MKLRYNRLLFLILSLFVFNDFLFAKNMPVRNQDVSPAQLQKQNTEIVQLVAKEESKNLPQKIDKYTTITSIKAKGTALIYTFEINAAPKSDEAVIKEDHSRMQKAVTRGVCKNSRRFMNAQIKKIYVYKSAVSKRKLFEFVIDQDACIKLFGLEYSLNN